jgi:sterol desaturase/sphingolipid hydroxylase (fatty acid hydroxylase superfamily)
MDIKYVQIILLACVFGLQYLFEHIYPQKSEINDWKNERFNFGIGLLNLALSFLPVSFIVQWIVFIEERNYGLFNQFVIPAWLLLLASVVVMDFWMYVWHRLNHTVPFLWRLHSFHHKDEKMNSTTAVRFHILELFLSYPGKALVCFVFGISYLNLLVYEILFFAAIVIHHSNIRISNKADAWYRILFASPLMHRIHHSNKWEETNSNYGALFSFWDRIFFSWRPDPKSTIQFGIPKDN